MLFPHTGGLIHSLRSDKVRALPSLRWCDSGEGVLFPSFKHPWKPAGLWVITGTMIDRSVSPSWAIQFPLSTQPAAHCSSQTDSTCDTAGRTAQRLLRASPHLTQFLHPSYSYTSQIIKKKWVWFFSQFFFSVRKFHEKSKTSNKLHLLKTSECPIFAYWRYILSN